MINFCKYKDILDKPFTRIHAIRFKNIAVVDVLLTIILAIVIKIIIKTAFSFNISWMLFSRDYIA